MSVYRRFKHITFFLLLINFQQSKNKEISTSFTMFMHVRSTSLLLFEIFLFYVYDDNIKNNKMYTQKKVWWIAEKLSHTRAHLHQYLNRIKIHIFCWLHFPMVYAILLVAIFFFFILCFEHCSFLKRKETRLTKKKFTEIYQWWCQWQ